MAWSGHGSPGSTRSRNGGSMWSAWLGSGCRRCGTASSTTSIGQEKGSGARQVVSDDEWRAPTFRYAFGDCADFGVELQTACGRLFAVSWDPPGSHEGSGSGRLRWAGWPCSMAWAQRSGMCRVVGGGIGLSGRRSPGCGCITGREDLARHGFASDAVPLGSDGRIGPPVTRRAARPRRTVGGLGPVSGGS
jgi:hypothetical protein